jgi:hypothetical protein
MGIVIPFKDSHNMKRKKRADSRDGIWRYRGLLSDCLMVGLMKYVVGDKSESTQGRGEDR